MNLFDMKNIKEGQISLIGKKFSRLTIVDVLPRVVKKTDTGNIRKVDYALCRCDCGNEKVIELYSLKSKNTRSCGCLSKEIAASVCRKRNTSHNKSGTPEFKTWLNVKSRCNNPSSSTYYKYGARGITISDEWNNSFEKFLNDMGLKPTPKHSIDRIDNSKGYSKGNCRWATNKEQCRNTRKNVIVEYNGSSMTMAELSEITGIKYRSIQYRISKGMTGDEAVFDFFDKEGRLKRYKELGRKLGNSGLGTKKRYG
jgi:hypothetical protein